MLGRSWMSRASLVYQANLWSASFEVEDKPQSCQLRDALLLLGGPGLTPWSLPWSVCRLSKERPWFPTFSLPAWGALWKCKGCWRARVTLHSKWMLAWGLLNHSRPPPTINCWCLSCECPWALVWDNAVHVLHAPCHLFIMKFSVCLNVGTTEKNLCILWIYASTSTKLYEEDFVKE